jgi:hypothetical protein
LRPSSLLLVYRAFSYTATILSLALGPLLTLKLTNSIEAAGFVLLVQWLPKALIYMFGGQLASGHNPFRILLWSEIARIGATVALAALSILSRAAETPDHPQALALVLALSIGIIQCSSAIANILLENCVTALSNNELASSHGAAIRVDLGAVASAMLAMLLVPDDRILLIGAASLHIASLGTAALLLRLELSIFTSTEPHSIAGLGVRTIRCCRSLITTGTIWQAFPTFTAVLVEAVVFAAFPFIARGIDPQIGLSDIARLTAVVVLLRALGASLVLNVVPPTAFRYDVMGVIGSVLVALAGMTISFHSALEATLAATIGVYWGLCIIVLWARVRRQRLMTDNTERLGMTGLLLSVDAIAYALGGLLMTFFDVHRMLLVMSVLGLMAWLVYYWCFAKHHRRNEFRAPL